MLRSTLLAKNQRRKRRMNHVRRLIRQRSGLPRLSVTRTLKHITAQVIDDKTGHTLCAVSSTAKALAGDLDGKNKSQCAAFIGGIIAEKAKAAGIESVVFDRGHGKYHGRIKALADAAREGGLKF